MTASSDKGTAKRVGGAGSVSPADVSKSARNSMMSWGGTVLSDSISIVNNALSDSGSESVSQPLQISRSSQRGLNLTELESSLINFTISICC